MIENIERFIVYEDELPRKKITLNNSEGIKIVKQIKINRDALIQNLELNKIIQSQKDITAILGTPFIMVMPQLKDKETIIEALQKNDTNKHAAGVIQGALTQKRYDVVLPDQQKKLNSLVIQQVSTEKDAAYELALSLGSDVYIDFNISSSEYEYETKKYAATLRAFETSTARLLGSETGHSNARRGDDYVSVEEAILQALGNLLSRVSNYWKDDIVKGLQYKTIISISTKSSFKAEELEEIQDGIIDALESISNSTKEIVITDHTIDYLVWVDPEQFNSARKVYRKIKSNYKASNSPGKLSITNQNRKLLQITVK